MNYWKLLPTRLRALFQKRRLDAEMDEEMRGHIESRVQQNLAGGMSPGEARFAAMRQFGRADSIKEHCRDQRGTRWLETFVQDFRYGARQLFKHPGFTSAAVLTLALGIGANTAIFSVIDAVLLKSLPVRNPEQLVALNHAGGDRGGNGFPYPVFEQLRDGNEAFTELFAFATWPEVVATIKGREEALPGGVQMISGEYHAGLGIKPLLGRLLSPEDNRVPGGHPVAVISHAFWQRKFGADPAAIGQAISLNGTSHTIIGVTPPEFFGVRVGRSDAITIPIMMESRMIPEAPFFQDPRNWDVEIMGRLKPGLSEAQAAAGLRVLFQRIELDEAGGNPAPERLRIIKDRRIELQPASQGLADLRKKFSEPLRILMGVAGLVLLIACANVANLLLSRASSRQKEIAVRLALGAGRLRLTRQLLTESLLLAVLGGVAGLLFAKWIGGLCVALIPDRAGAMVLNLSLDGRMLAFTALVSLLTGIVFGLAPAWQATRPDLNPTLKEGAETGRRGPGRFLLGQGLVGTQVALSLILLIAAGLFVRTFQQLKTLDPGFVAKNLVLFSLDSRIRGLSADQATVCFQQLFERLGQTPGVASLTLSRDANFGDGSRTRTTITVAGKDAAMPVATDVFHVPAGPRYFETFGTPLIHGREFTLQDDARAPKVAILNQAAARRLFGNENPVGRHIGQDAPEDTLVIGLAKDTKLGNLAEPAQGVVYRPFLQSGAPRRMTFAIRTAVPPGAMMTALRRELEASEWRLPMFGFKTLESVVARSLSQERLFAVLSSLFGLVALALAAVGLHGVMAYAVNQRRREIGLRIALGAPTRAVLRLILGQGMKVVLASLVFGLIAALALVRVIASRLHGIAGNDPLVLGGVSALLLVVALLACYLPARRASRTDPIVALRGE